MLCMLCLGEVWCGWADWFICVVVQCVKGTGGSSFSTLLWTHDKLPGNTTPRCHRYTRTSPMALSHENHVRLVATVSNWSVLIHGLWEQVGVCANLEQWQLIPVSCLISFIIRLTAEYLHPPLSLNPICLSHGKYSISIYLPYSLYETETKPHLLPFPCEFAVVTLTSSCSEACLIFGMRVSVIW